MIKLIAILYKRPDLSREAFWKHWQEKHAPLAAKLPGLRKYCINPAIALPGSASEPPFDGVAELWFDSVEAYRAAFAAPEGQAVRADSPNFLDANRSSSIVAEEHAIV